MTKIRQLYFFDKKYATEMISFLNNDDSFVNNVVFNPFVPLHHLLPLRFKFFPESYVLKEQKEMKGLITVVPTKSPLKQIEIHKLLFEENCYNDAGELIQYVVSKYKAMGTTSVLVKIDDYLTDLIRTFVSKCGFSQISYEKLWNSSIKDNLSLQDLTEKFNHRRFRSFRNSDSPMASSIYDDELLPHIRPLLSKEPNEFKDSILKGLNFYTDYKYVYRDEKTNRIYAFLFLRTSDNINYILDIIHSSWDEINLEEIIYYALAQIKKRTCQAKLFIKTKKYTQQHEQYEKELINMGFECVQNKAVLTNSSAKVIKSESMVKKYTVLGQFYSGLSVTNKVS